MPPQNGSMPHEDTRADDDDASSLADQLNGVHFPKGSQVKVLMQGVQQAHGRISQLQDENKSLRARLASLEQNGVIPAQKTDADVPAPGKNIGPAGSFKGRKPAEDVRRHTPEAKEWKAMYVDALKKLRDAQQELASQQGKTEQLQEQVRSLQDSDGASLTSATPSYSQTPSSHVGYPQYGASSPSTHSEYTRSYDAQTPVHRVPSEIQPADYQVGMVDHTVEARKKLPPVRTSRVVQKSHSRSSKSQPKWMQSLLSCVANSEANQPKQ